MELGPFLAPVEKLTWNDDLGFWCLSLSLCFWGFVLLGGRVCIGCARLGFLGFRGMGACVSGCAGRLPKRIKL